MVSEQARRFDFVRFRTIIARWVEVHDDDTCHDLLARTHDQRMADALCQMAADAVNSDKPSAPVKRVHNIVWTAEVYEELLRRWAGGPARLLDPGTYTPATPTATSTLRPPPATSSPDAHR